MRISLSVVQPNIQEMRVLVFLVIQALNYINIFLLESSEKLFFKKSSNRKIFKIILISIFIFSISIELIMLNPILIDHYKIELNKEKIFPLIGSSIAIYVISKLMAAYWFLKFNIKECLAFIIFYLILVMINAFFFRSHDYLNKVIF
jgi:hypothetical protein